MLLGVFGDIHSNYEALTASHKALRDAGCDKLICLGDIVGYGASPRECVEFIAEREIECVRGNHDHYSSLSVKGEWAIQSYARDVIHWTQDILDSRHRDYLASLPFMLERHGLVFVHASLEGMDGEYWPYILDAKSALFHFFLQRDRAAFFGHTHIPLLFSYDSSRKISIEILRSCKIPGGSGSKFLVNPGSVGQPRDFDSRGSVSTFDTETGEIKVIRVFYDIAGAQERILAAGLPRMLAERLTRGS
jgi:predicted phosphodiesterase